MEVGGKKTEDRRTLRAWGLFVLVCAVYLLFRIAILPTDGDTTRLFYRDPAYFGIIARNLVEGAGFVNDAHENVFMHPDSLPVPYHNANPLYPVFVAAGSTVCRDIPTAEYLVSALGNTLLLFGVAALVFAYDRRPGVALAAGLAAATFPVVFIDSLNPASDSLSVGLVFCALAAVVRWNWWNSVLAGLLLGLAWLTRGQNQLVVPAIVTWVLLQCTRIGDWPGNWKRSLRHLGVIAIVGAAVISPWLVHQYRVWGDPLRSDAYYSVIQDVVIEEFGGGGDSSYWGYWRFWNNPEPPPSPMEVLSSDPGALAWRLFKGSASVTKNTLYWWSLRSTWPLLALGGAIGFLLYRRPGWWRRPETVAIGVLALSTVGVLAIRYEGYEPRYLNSLTVLFAMFAALGSVELWTACTRLPARWPRSGVALAGAVRLAIVALWIAYFPWYSQIRYDFLYQTREDLVEYRELVRRLDAKVEGAAPVVVGTPYYYTFWSESPSIVFPNADDAFLVEYMRKFDAEYILLTAGELEVRRPAWREDRGLPSSIVRIPGFDPEAHLFRRSE